MARRAGAYPQVEPGADVRAGTRVVPAPADTRVGEALALARAAAADVVTVGGEAWVLRADLARAATLGLETLPARDLARRLPVVASGSSEVAVRRLLAAGTPAVIVRGPRGSVRAALPGAACLGAPRPSLLRQATRLLPSDLRPLVDAVAAVAAEQRVAAYLVGGVVREMVRGVPPAGHDLDVAVEGEGRPVARGLARRLGADVVEHERFLTATVAAPGARIDVATARDEHYAAPGALPTVAPAPIDRDLGRRDFTINAMAVELASGTLGLLDPHGGRRDAARRRLRVLHPLSFVEDPTRLFRAARYASRLGFTLDPQTRAAARLAVGIAPYPALSGQRLAAELARILADAAPGVALRDLGKLGALRLLHPRYRLTAATRARLDGLGPALAWARAHRLRVVPLELALVTLLADQPAAVRSGALARLVVGGEPARRIEAACAPGPGEAADARDDLTLAWRWLAASPGGRRRLAAMRTRQARSRPVLGGGELVSLGVPAGPAVGRALAALRQARLQGRVRDRGGEIRYVRDWIGNERSSREEG